jgi:hypothetical protein
VAAIIKREFPVDPSGLLPAVTPDNTHHWDALASGELHLQACRECLRVRFPIAPVCPYCRAARWEWRAMSGRGSVYSFVRYHRSYLPEFEDLMPYVVAVVELEEGARLFARLFGGDGAPRIGQPVDMVIEQWPDGRCVPVFELRKEDK